MNPVQIPPVVNRAPVRVLMLEDDELLRDHVLVPQLQRFGFEVVAVGCASDMDRYMQPVWPDIVILDVGLPDADGFAVARDLRSKMGNIGIVMLTGRNEMNDRVRGLNEGADAYLTKPVDIDLLGATLYSLARRLHVQPLPSVAEHWRLDADGWCLLEPGGKTIALTKTEGRLLTRMLETPNKTVSRSELIEVFTDNVFDFDTHRLDSLIHRLRKKVQRVAGVPLPLNAVHGEGFVFLVL